MLSYCFAIIELVNKTSFVFFLTGNGPKSRSASLPPYILTPEAEHDESFMNQSIRDANESEGDFDGHEQSDHESPRDHASEDEEDGSRKEEDEGSRSSTPDHTPHDQENVNQSHPVTDDEIDDGVPKVPYDRPQSRRKDSYDDYALKLLGRSFISRIIKQKERRRGGHNMINSGFLQQPDI